MHHISKASENFDSVFKTKEIDAISKEFDSVDEKNESNEIDTLSKSFDSFDGQSENKTKYSFPQQLDRSNK